jgi:Domain of unknown function (DUF4262)
MSILERVAKLGWTATVVIGDEEHPSFVYTTGLVATFEHPEVIIFGLEQRLAYDILALVVSDIRAGKRYCSPALYADLLTVPMALRPVHPTQHIFYFGDTLGFYRQQGRPGDFTAVQLFWSDERGLFPFDSACAPAVVDAQPRLYIARTPREIQEFLDELG